MPPKFFDLPPSLWVDSRILWMINIICIFEHILQNFVTFYCLYVNVKVEQPESIFLFLYHHKKNNWRKLYLVTARPWTKEYIERRHGEPFKFLFLPKMGLLGSQAVLEKQVQFWIMSNFLAPFFQLFMDKFFFKFFFYIAASALKSCLIKK